MVIASRPDFALNVAFNADPNDPAAVPVWNDLTALFLGADSVDRGRQYELDSTRGSQPTLRFMDPNESLNPDNPSSPYAPNVVPYRMVLWQAMWPNATSGNLLNTGYGNNPVLKTTSGYDPTFESYTHGSTPPWVSAVGGISLPVIGNTTPHGGSQDLTWTVATGSTSQGAQFVVPCIPGRQYTCSAYVRQTSASTQQIFVVGAASGSFASTTGAYFRLSVTWTATQPTHTIQVATQTGFATAGTVIMDDIQHEQASSASTFTTTGPTIFTIMRDLVERWPSRWDPDSQGFLGLCDAICVDAFAALQATDLSTEYRNAVLAKKPDYYWPLSEPQGATTFAEASGNNGRALIRTDAAVGPATTFAAGVTTNIAGDPSGTGVETQTPGTAFVNTPATVVQVGLTGSGIVLGANTAPYAYTVAMWVARSPTVAGDDGRSFFMLADHQSQFQKVAGFFQQEWAVFTSGTLLQFICGHAVVGVNTDSWGDGKPHLYVVVTSVGVANTTATVYIDGVSVGSSTDTIVNSTNVVMDMVEAGGRITPGLGVSVPGPQNGVYSHLGLWNRALSVSEITDLWNAGKGYLGETSGARIARYLSNSYIGPTVVDTGQSVMGVSVLSDGTSTLNSCQAVVTTENGTFYVDGGGNVTFAARTRRYLATTPAYVFGENTIGYSLTDTASRTVSNGLGAADTGQPYAAVGGNPGDYNVGSGVISITLASTGASRKGILPPLSTDFEAYGVITCSAVATGAPIEAGIIGHLASSTDYYMLGVQCTTAGTLQAFWTRVGGAAGGIVTQTAATGLSYSPGTAVNFHIKYSGTSHMARVWTTGSEPITWQLVVTASDTMLDPMTTPGIRAIAESGNTNVSPVVTFDNLSIPSPVELPYEGDMEFGFDPTLLYNDVKVTNSGGVVARVGDATSQKRYFTQSYSRNVNLNSDLEAIDAANYLLNQHKTPRVRVQTITLSPWNNPALWPVILGIELGTRITVRRRSKAANNGAGLTQSRDFFVEQISHSGIDFEAGTWTTTLQLSPVDYSQVWLLGDTTYSVLGTTTILGY